MDTLRQTCILFLCCLFPAIAYSQLKTNVWAFGAGGGYMLGDTDFGREDEGGPFAGAFFRHAIIGPLEGQLGGSYFGRLKGTDAIPYRTDIGTVDYRLLVRPLALEPFSIYLYGGGGMLYYDTKELPAVFTPGLRVAAWKPYVPAGGGLQIKIAGPLSLDIGGGYTFAFTDALNQVAAAEDDGFFSGQAVLVITGPGGNADSDGDGITNREEKRLGTNKNLADSDGDGLNDGEELFTYKTHPLRVDTDGDRLDDREEVLNFRTNPRKSDSDWDGLSDADEVFTHETDPLNKDTDGDRLSDRDEVMVAKTNPKIADMDGDGLGDGVEIVTYKTDPRNGDSDGDGLPDGEEINTYRTDPLNKDTDGDGTDDADEIREGRDPLTADDNLLAGDINAPIILENVTFESGKATLTPQSVATLEQAYNTLVAYPEMVVEIRGHTDNTGGRSLNLRLSGQRAQSVKDYLVSRGIEPSRILTRGMGPDRPIAPNNTREGRAKNRRIEFMRVQ